MNVEMKNIVLVDFDIDEKWSFPQTLESVTHERWETKRHVTNHLHGGLLPNLIRFFWYFFFPLIILIRRKQYDKVIGWQQFYGLNFAFWSRFLGLKKVNDLTVMTFIYKKKGGLKGKLYHKYMSYVVTSKYIDRFICFAKEECRYYSDIFGIDESNFIYVPLGHPMVTDVQIADDGYIFSTGRSNRDYDFLVNSLKNTSFKLIIACDTYHASHHGIVENINVLNDCYGNDMLALMAKCHCVVVPLKNLKMSSGQLVVLQAMSLGKPVICTDADGIRDYVINGSTGFLIDNVEEQLLTVLNELYVDVKKYTELSNNSKECYLSHFTEDAMYERIANTLKC